MKRVIAAGLALVLTFGLAACKDKDAEVSPNGNDTTAALVSFDPAEYVTLGEYENLPITITGNYDTSDEAFSDYIDEKLAELSYIKDEKATTVKKNSIVNVDYQGLQDGVAFEGGTAEDQTLDVGNNCMADGSTGFIDGFTSGLVGAKVGDTVDCDVTFPEDYGAPNLAGQEVVFRFTVNYICKATTSQKDLTDDFVKEYFDYDTVEDFKTGMKEEFEESVNAQKTSAIRSAVIQAVVKNAKINGYPEDVLSQRKDSYLESYTAQYGGYEAFEAQMSSYGVNMDDFVAEMEKGIKSSLESEMVFTLVADTAGLKVDEDGFSEYCSDLAKNNGFSSTEELFTSYGGSAEAGKEYLKRIYICNKAVEYCMDHVGEVTIENEENVENEED